MSNSKKVFRVSSKTSLSEILKSYLDSTEDLVFLDENSVITDPHLELLTDFPRGASAALVGKITDQADTLVRRGVVVSASSSTHTTTTANRVFAGAIYLSQKQRAEIQRAVDGAVAAKATGHALDLLLVALVRATIRVDAVELLGAPFARSSDQKVREQAAKEIAALSIPRLRLKMANRANDGFFSVFFLRRISKLLTWVAIKVWATPNQVTLVSFAIGLYAAYLLTKGDPWSLLLGALLLQLSIVVDCVDGELARYTRKFSELGAWLDAITDRVKEYAVFFGLAFGAFVQQGINLWWMAAILMSIQTFRHLSDYNFSQVIKARDAEQIPVPVDFMASWDGIEAKADADDANEAEPSYLRKRIRYWIRKMVIFPIGERWLAISVTAAVGGALLTFTVLPILAAISMFWVYRVRILKSLEMAKTRIASKVIAWQLDLGFVEKTYFKRLDWLEPSILRALELGGLIVLFAATGKLWLDAYVILFAIAFHHYDNLYRAMQSEQKPEWLAGLGLTVLGRMVILTLATLLNWNLLVFAGYFLLLFVFVGPIQWVASHKLATKKSN